MAADIADEINGVLAEIGTSNTPVVQKVNAILDKVKTQQTKQYIEDHIGIVLLIVVVIFLSGFLLGRK